MKYEYVFWDWNGTLLDDVLVAFNAVNDMLTARKLNNITLAQYRDYIDVPIIKFYERVLDMSNETMDGIALEFHSLCEKRRLESSLAVGAEALLRELNSQGVKQYIFSSSREDRITPYLKEYRIDKYFSSVIAASDSFAGSKAERTRDYLAKNNIPPQKCLFIGDLVHDSETALFIGADCALLSCGHQSKNALIATGRKVFESFSALSEHIIKCL